MQLFDLLFITTGLLVARQNKLILAPCIQNRVLHEPNLMTVGEGWHENRPINQEHGLSIKHFLYHE